MRPPVCTPFASNVGISNACDHGGAPIDDESACQAAASYLNVPYQQQASLSYAPGGCMWFNGGTSAYDGFYLNTHAGSSTGTADHHKVCAFACAPRPPPIAPSPVPSPPAPPSLPLVCAPYTSNVGITNACDSGEAITDVSVCQAAASALNVSYRLQGSFNYAPGGCMWYNGTSPTYNGLYLNSNVGSSAGTADHHKVCFSVCTASSSVALLPPSPPPATPPLFTKQPIVLSSATAASLSTHDAGAGRGTNGEPGLLTLLIVIGVVCAAVVAVLLCCRHLLRKSCGLDVRKTPKKREAAVVRSTRTPARAKVNARKVSVTVDTLEIEMGTDMSKAAPEGDNDTRRGRSPHAVHSTQQSATADVHSSQARLSNDMGDADDAWLDKLIDELTRARKQSGRHDPHHDPHHGHACSEHHDAHLEPPAQLPMADARYHGLMRVEGSATDVHAPRARDGGRALTLEQRATSFP